MPIRIVAYMTRWCPDCSRARRVLQQAGATFQEIDIDATPGAEAEMRALNGGSGKVPTLIMESGSGRAVLIEPSDSALREILCTLPE